METENPGSDTPHWKQFFKNFGSQEVIQFHEIEDVVIGTSDFHIVSKDDYEALFKLTEHIVTAGLVKDFPGREEREYDDSDFRGVAIEAVKSFRCLKLLLQKLVLECLNMKLAVDFAMSVLKLCATHSQVFMWSDDTATSLESEILRDILEVFECQDIMQLLCRHIKDHPYTLFKNVMLSMRPSLAKETWVYNPCNPQIFKWFLLHVKHPHLVDYLQDVLPPSLMFIDHFSVHYKVLGIECLSHIIDNVPPSELRLYGRAEVVYDALFHLTYFKETEVVRVLYPCLLKFLSGQERNLHVSRQPRKWGRFDDVYHQLMWNMEMEDKIVLRQQFSAHVPFFIEKMGITIAKHMQRTKRVLLEYISISDGPGELSRINALRAMSALIKVAWPRMEHHCEDFLKSIMFLVYDIEADKVTSVPEVRESLLSCSKECMLLLHAACPKKFQELAASLEGIEDNLPGLNFFFSVYKASTMCV